MSFTRDQVATHNSISSSWIIIDNNVYDITKFAILHPGGKQVLLDMAGKEATKEFEQFHKSSVLTKYHDKLFVGEIVEEEKIHKRIKNEFIPYSEPKWLQGGPSPYYNKSHLKFNNAVREFTEKEVIPNTFEWEDVKKEVPKSFRLRCGQVGLLSGLFGKWPKQYVPNAEILNGISPDEFDYFHELILIDQMSKCGSFGVLGNVFVTHTIGLSPIINFGSKYLQDKVVPPCLSGEKMICLAITEPNAGSDVANLKTTAKKSPDGKFYILNGEKKFITNGIWGDYFTVGARTGGSGMSGISVFLVEKEMVGVKARRLNMQGSWASGTSYITFDDVKVPAENLIGKEGEGFKYIMYNFNHERWGGIVQALRYARICYEDSYRYAFKRKTFGKKLIEHQIIRQKLGDMIRQIESAWAWLEYITYQMNTMSHEEQNIKLGGDISFLKVQTTKLVEFCAREAVQIFGGLGYSRGGQGERVERIYRDVRVLAIGGGSEEVMLDFGVRDTIRKSKL